MACTINDAKQRILNKWDWSVKAESDPVILWGPPGVGKTELIVSLVCERMIYELEAESVKLAQQYAADLDNVDYVAQRDALEEKKKLLNFTFVTHELLEITSPHLLVIRLAERPIEQLQGVVVPSLSENFARFVMPENLAKIKNSPWGIVFLDELDKASDSKFGAATHILENNVIGDYQLPKGWITIAACNREEDSFLSNPVPPELRNRAANIEVTNDLNTWMKWAAKNGVRSDILMFHRFTHGEWLAKYDLEQTYAFPTPRTWAKASRAISRLEARVRPNTTEEKEKFFDKDIRAELEDYVGREAAMQYFMYRKLYLAFPVSKILSGELRLATTKDGDNRIISEQCTAAFAIADQLTANHLKPAGSTKEEQAQLMKNFVTFITDLHPDIRALFLQSIHKTRIMNMLMDSKLAENLIEEIVQYIAA